MWNRRLFLVISSCWMIVFTLLLLVISTFLTCFCCLFSLLSFRLYPTKMEDSFDCDCGELEPPDHWGWNLTLKTSRPDSFQFFFLFVFFCFNRSGDRRITQIKYLNNNKKKTVKTKTNRAFEAHFIWSCSGPVIHWMYLHCKDATRCFYSLT